MVCSPTKFDCTQLRQVFQEGQAAFNVAISDFFVWYEFHDLLLYGWELVVCA